MEAHRDNSNITEFDPSSNKVVLSKDDHFALANIRFAQGTGAALRYANELRAVQQVKRLPFLKSSNLHEDVLRGNLGPGSSSAGEFDEEFGGYRRIEFL